MLSEQSFELHAGFKLLKKKRDALKAKFQAPWTCHGMHRSSEGEFFVKLQAGLGSFCLNVCNLGPFGLL